MGKEDLGRVRLGSGVKVLFGFLEGVFELLDSRLEVMDVLHGLTEQVRLRWRSRLRGR